MKERAARIQDYMQHFTYHPDTVEDRLNESQLLRLNQIRLKLKQIREEVNQLVAEFQTTE